VSTDPKASTARDRLTLSLDRRLRFEDGDARGCVALLYRCTVVRRETLTCSIAVSARLLPKSVVGWITHHRPGVGVLKPILPATFSDLYDPGQVDRKPPRASTGA
jgi:hypothetical protein